MRTMKVLSILAALAMLAALLVFPAQAAPLMQAGNLLKNPSWEGGSAGGWDWWSFQKEVMQEGSKKDPDLENSFYAPNFQPSATQWDKESNGEGGAAGELSGLKWRKFRAGYRQTVDVAAGSRVRFSVYANEYCKADDGHSCGVILKAGIDPTGGTDAFGGSVKWVEAVVSNNKYVPLTTDEVTVGEAGKVTVFTWGEPKEPVLYNAAYFDEANLVVTAAAAAQPTQAAQAQPTQAPAAQPAQPAQPAACAKMRYVSDVTIPDDAPIAPGAQFVKTWRVQNSGTCAYAGTLNFIGKGDQMGGQSPTNFAKLEVGQTADISVNLTAPAKTGSYQGTWQAVATDGTVLENLFLKINVTGSAPAAAISAPGIAAVTATPQAAQAPAASPTPTNGVVCFLAFNDKNGDGQQGSDENLLAGVVFTLSDSGGPRDSYTTDGVSEPHCLNDLTPGSYQITAKPPASYTATTQKTTVLAINGGTQADVQFGSRRGGAVATPTGSAGGSGATSAGLLGGAGRIVLIVVAVLILIGLGFAGGFVLMSRR